MTLFHGAASVIVHVAPLAAHPHRPEIEPQASQKQQDNRDDSDHHAQRHVEPCRFGRLCISAGCPGLRRGDEYALSARRTSHRLARQAASLTTIFFPQSHLIFILTSAHEM